MKIEIVKPKESYKAQMKRGYADRILKNEQAKEFGTDEVEVAPTPSHFWRPIAWVINLILWGFESLRKNLYDAMDESVEIYEISTNDLKRLNFKGVDVNQFNGQIVLMSLPTMQRKHIACINWKGSQADMAKQCHDMLALAGVSTYVTVPPLTITALGVLATTYGNSLPGGEQTAFTNMNNGMIGLMFLFQTYANSNPGSAELAIKSGGFDVRKVTPRKSQPWSAKNNPVAGIIDLTAGGGGKYSAHDWWISYNGSTFVRLTPTMKASCQVTGLASGITVYFMHQVIGKDGPQGFDLVIKIPVD